MDTIVKVMLIIYATFLQLMLVESLDSVYYTGENPCIELGSRFQCQKSGLLMLPDRVDKKIDNIVIINQSFRNPVLSPGNFTDYPEELIKFTLSTSGVSRINSRTFADFTSIKQIMLKSNNIKYVDSEAFANVIVDELDLSENPRIQFHQDAFKDSKIFKLSLKKCDLISLPYVNFEPLFMNGGLGELNIAENLLQELHPDFFVHFRDMKNLILDDNPIQCKCSMKWLLKLGDKTKGLKCSSPDAIKGSNIQSLKEDDIDCQLPKINRFHLDVDHSSSGDQLFINVKCHASGTDELQMKLIRYRNSSSKDGLTDVLQEKKRTKSLSVILRQPNSQLTFGGITNREVYDEPNTFTENLRPEHIGCIIEDLNGNLSTDLIVKWPSIKSKMMLDRNELLQAKMNSPQGGRIEGDFFLKKKFTILEMIGAVIGTFITTILAFICLYCVHYDSMRGCYFSCCPFRGENDHKIFSSTNQILKDVNLTTGLLQYQNANTNSGPHSANLNANLPFSPMSQLLMPPGYPSNGSDDTSNNTHSSSSVPYDTNSNHNNNATLNKRSSYATYDALSGNANGICPTPAGTQQNQNLTYTDCQTYDLPQGVNKQIQAPTPLLPLPPIPREGVPPLPTPVSIYNQSQGNFFDPNQNAAHLQAALTVATLSRMQQNSTTNNVQHGQPHNLDVNLLQQQWNYLTMLQNNLASPLQK